jgi:hypothetical protein
VVPPHRRDKISPEKLQPLQKVEPGRFVTCWKKQKKQAKSKVLRDPCLKRKKMEQPLLGRNQHTDRKEKKMFCGQNGMHKIRGLHRVKNKNLIQK